MVSATLGVANAIITESALSFLGFGRRGLPDVGRRLFDGANFMMLTPARVIWPGLAISLTVLSINFIGDGLRDALDLRIRGRFFSIFFTNGHARFGVEALQEANSPLPVRRFRRTTF